MIYFIEAVGAGLVKIGFTERSARERLKDLQTGCPHALRVAAACDGDRTEELRLHGQWGYLREGGEWFRIDDRLQWFIHWVAVGRPDADRLVQHTIAAECGPNVRTRIYQLEEDTENLNGTANHLITHAKRMQVAVGRLVARLDGEAVPNLADCRA